MWYAIQTLNQAHMSIIRYRLVYDWLLLFLTLWLMVDFCSGSIYRPAGLSTVRILEGFKWEAQSGQVCVHAGLSFKRIEKGVNLHSHPEWDTTQHGNVTSLFNQFSESQVAYISLLAADIFQPQSHLSHWLRLKTLHWLSLGQKIVFGTGS